MFIENLEKKRSAFSHEEGVISTCTYRNKRSTVLRYFAVTFVLIGILIREHR